MHAAAEIVTDPSDGIRDAEEWVKAHRSEIPAFVYDSVLKLSRLKCELEKERQRSSKLLDLFRRELGVVPKSERGTLPPEAKGAPLSDEEKLAKLKARRLKLLAEIRRYEDRLGKRKKSRQKPKQPSEAKANPAFASSEEKLFTGNIAGQVDEAKRLRVDRMKNFENPRGLHAASDDRTRHEYGITTKTIHLSVETVSDPRTGKSVTASTDDIGPPNTQVTWTAVANTVISVIGYAIPINRLASMLKPANPYFTSSRLCSHLGLSAELFAPIYSCLGEQLSESEVLLGDDTKAKVIEISRSLKNGGELHPPAEGSLAAQIAEAFGRAFDRKNGKGKKRSLNVSTVIGKSNASDPRSYIFFFRSHLGSTGDLISKMLENRSPRNKNLTIVSDLASTNLLNSALYETFQITHAGCAAHARRPFWRHKDKDQRLCYWMLSAFLVLEEIEDRIDEAGRTRANIERFRQRFGRKVWEAMRRRCESIMRGETVYGQRWPESSDIYGACRYIVENYPELTAYLDDPRLPSTNNLSERVLRWDKIMEDSSKFRMTEAGRIHVDILRTIVHTCSAAEVELKDYLLFVFKNRKAIESDPSQFTPYAYAQLMDAAKN